MGDTNRCDNVAHEIISSLRNDTEEQIKRVIDYAHENNIVYLANVFRRVVQCRDCFMKYKCSDMKFCFEVIKDYMEGNI